MYNFFLQMKKEIIMKFQKPLLKQRLMNTLQSMGEHHSNVNLRLLSCQQLITG